MQCNATTTDLRRLLYGYFSTYGKVIDVVALKNDKMRGQAFVVFKDLATSTAALRKEDGRVFAGKALKISYARGKSFATIEDESGKEALYQYRLGIHKDPSAKGKLTVSGAGKVLAGQQAAAAKRERQLANGDGDNDGDEDEGDAAEGAAKRPRTDGAEQEDEEMEMSSDDDDDAA
jgi:RNA recognition motif-containing protein